MSHYTIPVILLTGRKGSGKDTFGGFLREALNKILDGEVQSIAFADPIKVAAREILGIPDSILWGNTEVKDKSMSYGKTVRHILQWMGTEVFRDQIHPDVWVHGAARRILAPPHYKKGWIITDCRFPNEWGTMRYFLERGPSYTSKDGQQDRIDWGIPDANRDYKCFLVKVLRPEALKSSDAHRSETSIDELDKFSPIVVPNDSTLAVLKAQAELLAHKIHATLLSEALVSEA